MPSPKGSSQPRDRTHVSCIGRQIPYHRATWETHVYLQTKLNVVLVYSVCLQTQSSLKKKKKGKLVK